MFLLPGGTLHSSSEWKNQDHSRITVAFNLAHLPKPGFEWELLLNETEVADLVKQRQGARDINVLPEYRSDPSAHKTPSWAFITNRPKDRYEDWMHGLGSKNGESKTY